MPDWVKDKPKRLAKIREARKALEAEARAAAAAETRRRAAAAQGRKKTGKTPKPPRDVPDGKAQRNFTDPESRILKTRDGFV
jgi:septal ring factor EnvC (AmiA/AmiB activator)